jgi:hypothetical protein
MTQDAPNENEEELADTELCGDTWYRHGIMSPILEDIDFELDIPNLNPSSNISPEMFGTNMQTNTENNEEVDRAIRQINSKLEAIESTSEETTSVIDVVNNLHNRKNLESKRKLLEKHNLRIVQQLLASDTGALSPKEVQFRNRGIISESTVRDHLRNLTEEEFTKKLEPDVESIPNEMPRTFYAASLFTIELLQEMGLWENLGMLYQIYDSLERPDEIRRIEEWEERPTPDWM